MSTDNSILSDISLAEKISERAGQRYFDRDKQVNDFPGFDRLVVVGKNDPVPTGIKTDAQPRDIRDLLSKCFHDYPEDRTALQMQLLLLLGEHAKSSSVIRLHAPVPGDAAKLVEIKIGFGKSHGFNATLLPAEECCPDIPLVYIKHPEPVSH